MGRDSKPKRSTGRGVSVSEAKRRKPSAKHRREKNNDEEGATKTGNGENNNNLAAESLKARQLQSSKELGGEAETCRINFKNLLDRDRPQSKLQMQRYEEFTREAVTKGVKGVLEEYGTYLKGFIPPNETRVAFDGNPDKNRYSDVVCFDQSRVVLKNHTTDYIHANYVRGDPLINTFICTQGPMMNSIKDFWKMVSQENVGNIIMLCDTVEQGKEKCQQYWPREQGCTVEWPGIQVKNVKIDTTDNVTLVSTLELIFDKKEKITVKHHHWRTWPDKSVPQSVLSPFRLLKIVRHSARPTIVHCSAGIGRTGTVVALELCYQQILSENKLSVLESVKALRVQRMHAVQTELQYLYLYKCLLTLSQKSKTIPPDFQAAFDTFENDYTKLIQETLEAEKKDEAYTPLTPLKFLPKK